MKKYVPSALAALALAAVAIPLGTQGAQAAGLPAPEFTAAKYDDSYFARGDLKDLTIGNAFKPSFATNSDGEKVSIVDEKGQTHCITTAIWCDFTSPLAVGDHTLRAVTERSDEVVESQPLTVHVVNDDIAGDQAASPAPGDVDPGFTVETPTPGLAAPEVTLGDTLGGKQNLIVSLPETSNVNASHGHVLVVDETGKQIVDRGYSLGGSDVAIPVPAEQGTKHTYSVSIKNEDGLTPKTEIVVDNESAELAAPRFEDEPQVVRGDLIANILGMPGTEATITNVTTGEQDSVDLGEVGAGQVRVPVAADVKNVFTVVVTKAGHTSAPLNHVVDLTPTTPAPTDPAVPVDGSIDPGFTVDTPVENDATDAPRVLSAAHATVKGKHVIRLWIAPPADSSARIVVSEDDKTQEFRQSPTQEYLFEIGDREVAHDLTVTLKTGSGVSTPVTVHVDAIG